MDGRTGGVDGWSDSSEARLAVVCVKATTDLGFRAKDQKPATNAKQHMGSQLLEQQLVWWKVAQTQGPTGEVGGAGTVGMVSTALWFQRKAFYRLSPYPLEAAWERSLTCRSHTHRHPYLHTPRIYLQAADLHCSPTAVTNVVHSCAKHLIPTKPCHSCAAWAAWSSH